ncbi:response regulator transcription factor [Clostridium oryzae]|uniref:Stage 0 sporulation protein A homolog n=1 Tax=Clostridium oryzae TaxID=1450648 RepID=A0A1V4IX21_9CLOT|nr:response regulator transcription factor [Clostridium oryzae]OPJ64598.1 putative response regulatory protein [Clostridium oryzae]
MYSVMLIDDEVFILNGLKDLIDWTSLGLSIDNVALNGEEAIKLFNKKPADIIITDICMPKVNGLELIKEIKKVSEKTKFIVLSGYDDFNYAKESISLGIENYILKPINEKELYGTLEAIKAKLESEVKYNNMISRDKEILKDNILYRLMMNNINLIELKEREFLLDIRLDYEHYSVAIMKCDLETSGENTIDDIYDFIEDSSANREDICIFNNLEGNIVILFGSNKFEGFEAQILEYLKDIKNTLWDTFHVKCFITQGNIECGCLEVYKSYEIANKLQNYLLVQGYDKIINYFDYTQMHKLSNTKFSVNSHDFEKVILSKDQAAIDDYIDGIFEELKQSENITPDLVQNIAIKMLIEVNKICNEFNIQSNHENLRDMILKICTIRTVDELKDEIKFESKSLVGNIKNVSQKMSPITKQVLSYIKENYYEELSLKTLGNKYNINPFYLGQIFHKEVGQNFSEFINKVKNEKAKELLLSSNLKVSEVAKKVGYTDNSYFYRKFKEHFGVSPNSLRENKNY